MSIIVAIITYRRQTADYYYYILYQMFMNDHATDALTFRIHSQRMDVVKANLRKWVKRMENISKKKKKNGKWIWIYFISISSIIIIYYLVYEINLLHENQLTDSCIQLPHWIFIGTYKHRISRATWQVAGVLFFFPFFSSSFFDTFFAIKSKSLNLSYKT